MLRKLVNKVVKMTLKTLKFATLVLFFSKIRANGGRPGLIAFGPGPDLRKKGRGSALSMVHFRSTISLFFRGDHQNLTEI